ncbi:hypothetical protein PRUPE_7G254400 [Prunus persica]|uniref:Uncharacterized protein n=1 Tax=Prunus persica TaxID=3760 RepID=M5VQE5_PRUPE|nr:hypothetical protein PRUPE_7G254400 [Prunus persica]
MTSAGVAGMMFQCVFEGSLSMRDSEIELRPYHKNCSCALHRSEGGVCSNACQRNISFPKKQPWSDGFLCMQAAASSKFSSPLLLPMSFLVWTWY